MAGRIEILKIAIILGVLTLTTKNAQAQSPESFVEMALKANGDIESKRKAVEEMSRMTQAVKMWPDPVLALEYSNFPVDTFSMGDSAMTGLQFKLIQGIPFPGKNSRRSDAVKARMKVKHFEMVEAENMLRASLMNNYWRLSLTRSLKELTEKHIKLIDQFNAAVQSRYRTGGTSQHDLLRLNLLQAKLTDDLADFDRKEKGLGAAINSTVGREPGDSIETEQPRAAMLEDYDERKLTEIALGRRARLKMHGQVAKANMLAAKAASYERWPDISVWVGYRYREPSGMDAGIDQGSLGIAIPIPINYTGSRSAMADAALAAAEGAELRKLQAEADLKADLADACSAWKRAVQKAGTYRNSLGPLAEKALQAALSAYRTGKTGFESLFAAQLQQLNYDREIVRADIEAQLMKIEVEKQLGTSFDRIAKGETEHDSE